MTQLACWVLFPLVLGLLSLGCGLLLGTATGRPLPDGLLIPAGLAVIIVVAEVATKWSATAPVTTPLVVALAVLGVVLRRPWRKRPQFDRWPLLAAVAAYVVYLLPVLVTGEPTFTGYIKLDDSATWMAMTDRVLAHGHDLSGLAPSTYSTTLRVYLTGGEPVGAMLPWGIGHQLVRQDLAWVFQPYLAFSGAMVALAAWPIVGPVIRSRPARALVVFVAALSALLYGYSLWGGVKEMAAAWVLALCVSATLTVFEGQARIRSFLPLAVASLAMLGVLGYGGLVWLGVILVAVAVGALRVWIGRSTRVQLAALIAVGAAIAYAAVHGAQGFLTSNGALTGSELGNLIHRLNPLQMFGIWPAGDFRIDPPNLPGLSYALIGVVIAGALAGLLAASRSRWLLPSLYTLAAAAGALLVSAEGSPWVQGKGFATIAPVAPLLAMTGAAAAAERAAGWLRWETGRRTLLLGGARRAAAAAAAGVIAAGVMWSNASAYHHVTLAPYRQFAELEQIGKRFAGDGPTLINEYQPYAARHFLRDMSPESPSELRYRVVPLLGGGQLQKGGYADLDQFELAGLLVYRSIVIRTSPTASRPPAPYRLVFNGRWYQLWQRPVTLQRFVLDHLSLGGPLDPSGVLRCGVALRLAREAGPDGLLAAVSRPAPDVAAVPSPLPSGSTAARFAVARGANYEVWLGGSFVRRVVAYLDGRRIGSSHEMLNEPGEWTPLGTARVAAGPHVVRLSYGDAVLYPGSGGPGAAGPALGVGPLALGPAQPRLPVLYVRPPRARSLCAHSWDWVEALGPPVS